MTGINSDQLLTAPQGALVLVGYVLAFFFAALVVTQRTDVT